MSEAVARRLTVTEVVDVYERAEAMVRGAFAQLAAAEDLLNETFTMDACGSISLNRSGRINFGDPDSVLCAVRHDVWGSLVERLELRRMMSGARWRELQLQIERRQLPEINAENVERMLAGFQAQLAEMLREAVEEVFDYLRPRGGRYKTNSELEVPERVVLRFVVDQWGPFCTRWGVNHRADESLTALENVFSALDGQGQITKTHYSAISTAIRTQGFDGTAETPYFRFRVFKNGNMHLQFRRLDLLARFNAIAGGRRLRPAAAAE